MWLERRFQPLTPVMRNEWKESMNSDETKLLLHLHGLTNGDLAKRLKIDEEARKIFADVRTANQAARTIRDYGWVSGVMQAGKMVGQLTAEGELEAVRRAGA